MLDPILLTCKILYTLFLGEKMHAKQPHTVSLMFVAFDQEVHTWIEDIHSDRMRLCTLQYSPGQRKDSLFYFHVKLLQITSYHFSKSVVRPERAKP